MDILSKLTNSVFWKNEECTLLKGDSMELLPKLLPNSVDVIFADPPYFLSNGGVTCHSGGMVSVNKAEWDENMSRQEKHIFNRKWLHRCFRVLKPGGTIWVSGTLHNIYSIGMALEQENFKILNNITWQKSNPPPNLACRCFTHSTETILWAVKPDKRIKHFYNYAAMKKMNGNKQMKDVWDGPLTPQKEKVFGKHPTQKPEYLLNRIILASAKEGQLVLDPFCGTSTTGVAAINHGCRFIGIDLHEEYLDISAKRLNRVMEDKL